MNITMEISAPTLPSIAGAISMDINKDHFERVGIDLYDSVLTVVMETRNGETSDHLGITPMFKLDTIMSIIDEPKTMYVEGSKEILSITLIPSKHLKKQLDDISCWIIEQTEILRNISFK